MNARVDGRFCISRWLQMDRPAVFRGNDMNGEAPKNEARQPQTAELLKTETPSGMAGEVMPEIPVGQPPERYLTCAEVAALLGVKPRTVEQWVEERRIPFYRLGRSVRLRYSEVQAYLAQHCLCTPTTSLGFPPVED